MNIFKRIFGHLKTVFKHKAAVYRHMKRCGLRWQGFIHDLSKFTPVELFSSIKYFQGNRSPIDAEKEAIGYSNAWLHHKGKNKHHWEYWTDYNPKDGSIIANRMPKKYVVEMICDWIGAGQAYLKENWTEAEPLKFYEKVRNGRHLNPETESKVVHFVSQIYSYGLDDFYQEVQEWLHEDTY